MADQTTTLMQLKEQVAKFVQDRDWSQFHSPKNLSMDIAIEAAELMEKFVWLDTAESHEEINKNRAEIEDEFADILMGLLMFSNVTGIDMSSAFKQKLELTAQKYPINLVKGRSDKYTQYQQDKNRDTKNN